MDVLLLIIGLVLVLLGIVGSILPVLPGLPLCWVGLALLYYTDAVEANYWVLSITLLITIGVTVADYLIPAKGTKHFGGSKYGIWGTNIGLVVGLFFPPVGFIIGPFIGAFVGEIIYNSKDSTRALQAAIGSFVGFLLSTFMKLVVGISYLMLYVYLAATNFI